MTSHFPQRSALGNSSRNVYDANGNLTQQVDRNGNIWEYIYDANNRMVKAIDPLGFVTAYEYNANGQATKTVSALNAQTQSFYDEMGRIVKSTDAEGNETVYSYDILGRMVKVTFADSTFIENSYNANGWLVSALDQNGAGTSYEYNKNGQVTKITDAMNGITEYFYDALGRTTSVKDALDGVTAFVYDANGNLLKEIDALNGETSYIYDSLNRVISMTDANGNTYTMEYDANGNVTKATNPDGGVISYSYDLLDRLVSYTDAEGNLFSIEYDANGNTVATVDARNNRSTQVFDALNRAVASTDAAGFTSTIEYDADGRVVKTVNGEGAITNFIYDKNGNVTKVTDALGNSTTFTYDSMNRVVSMTDARGAVTKYSYTATGLVETVTDAHNEVYSYEYDLLGRLVKETNQLNESTSYSYDSLGRVLSTTNALGFTDSFSYDALGRIKSVTDKNGNVTRYNYDPNGNVIETIDALGTAALFEYDSMNRLVKMTLNRKSSGVNENQVTLYSYDKRGLVTREINAAGDETIYIYDGNGNLVQKTDADGYITEYGYDPRNLVEAINYADGKEVLFAYNGNGELVAMMDWNGTTSFELDLLGRITSVNDHNNQTTGYTYDSVGNQTSMKYPDGTVANYEFDLLGRMTKLTDAEKQATNYSYDAASKLISQAYPNGWNETHEYDAVGQLLRTITTDPGKAIDKTIEQLFTYDPNGNLLTEYRNSAAPDADGSMHGMERYNLAHSYDALNRLNKTTGDDGYKTHEYSYDSLGNLISEKIHNKTDSYTYNNLNQITSKIVEGKDTYNYSYDKRGNLVKVVYAKKNTVTEQYVYDSTNRMVKGVNVEGEESHYIFNGLGYLVANEWIIDKNNYGYTGVETDPSEQIGGVVRVCTAHSNTTGQGHQNPTGAGHFKDKGKTNDGDSTTGGTTGGIIPVLDGKIGVIHKDYVLDYTSALKDVILETESGVGGLTYRYVYGLEKVNTVITGIPNGAGSVMQYVFDTETGEFVLTDEDPGQDVVKNNIVKLWYHQDRLGSTAFLTDNVKGKVTSFVSYDDWGAPTMKAILRMGVRELDLVTEYTGHPYDEVLGVYFAEARMYDAADRRFMAEDLSQGNKALIESFAHYVYVLNNPLKYLDYHGLYPSSLVINGQPVVIVEYNGKLYAYLYDLVKAYDGKAEFEKSERDMWISFKFIGIYGEVGISIFVNGKYKAGYIMPNEASPYGPGGERGKYTATIDTASAVGAGMYVDFEYFMKLMCNIGQNTQINGAILTANYIRDFSNKDPDVIKALERINLYYLTNKAVMAEMEDGGNTMFFFEGLGSYRSLENGDISSHPNGRWGAMAIALKGSKITAFTKDASTLPDFPDTRQMGKTEKSIYDKYTGPKRTTVEDGKTVYLIDNDYYPATIKDGVYKTSQVLHNGYAALELDKSNRTIPAYRYDESTKTLRTSDTLGAGIRIHRGRIDTRARNNPTSTGCLTIASDVFAEFARGAGFMSSESEKATKSYSGLVIVDRTFWGGWNDWLNKKR